MVKVTVNGKEFKTKKGTKVSDFIELNGITGSGPIVGCLINNEQKMLSYEINKDLNIKFIDFSQEEGSAIYRRSLLFLFTEACRELYPNAKVIVKHSINQGIFCELKNFDGIINDDIKSLVETRMKEIVGEKVPFEKIKVTKDEAKKIYVDLKQEDKIAILDSIKRDTVALYSCKGFTGYFFGEMVPDTSYISVFELRTYEGGFLIRYPMRGDFYHLPPYTNQKKLFTIFSEFKKWNRILCVENVTMLNEIVKSGDINNYIRISEAFQEKKYSKIADEIKKDNDKKVILISGPSSSGKTTSSYRLAVQLMVNGIRPVTLSLDDYIVNRDQTPRDAEGKPDFESIYSIDLELFNTQLNALIEGREVEKPSFNFFTGVREFLGEKICLEEGQVVICEGLHALNNKLTEFVPQQNKFKIYVSALTSINIDEHNAIRTTEARLLRRIVRDNQFRGISPEETLELWTSVRRGEEIGIFPYQEEADEMFNSAMPYEIGVLKGFAEPLLKKISKESQYYNKAVRLLDFLQYFEVIDSKAVPQNSVIREFIGGSCFFKK